jgi:hypothetical protein
MKLSMLIVLAACAANAAPSPTITAPPKPGEWATWSHERKLEYMKSTVLPAERVVFRRFMPVRFAKFECENCHGSTAKERDYKLPNPDLAKLVGGKEGFQELADLEPNVLRFMQQSVVPETAKLLGLPAFDMEKHVGFSCYQCHTRADR